MQGWVPSPRRTKRPCRQWELLTYSDICCVILSQITACTILVPTAGDREAGRTRQKVTKKKETRGHTSCVGLFFPVYCQGPVLLLFGLQKISHILTILFKTIVRKQKEKRRGHSNDSVIMINVIMVNVIRSCY